MADNTARKGDDSQAVALRAEMSVALPNVVERLVVMGDVSGLTPDQRVDYYKGLATAIGVDWVTRPFDYLEVDAGKGEKKLVLYPNHGCAEQIRDSRHINTEIMSRQEIGDLYIVEVRVSTPDGRYEDVTGAVSIVSEEGEWKTSQNGKRYYQGTGKWNKLRGTDLANAIMKAECVPVDSQILTRDGWTNHDALSIGEDVLAFDCEAGLCKWTPLEAVTIYPESLTVRFGTAWHGFRCTPDHSWVVSRTAYKARTRGDGSRGPRGPYANRAPARFLMKASEVYAGQRVLLSAPAEGGGHPLTPAEAAVLGWVMCDGSIKRRGSHVRLGISQSKPDRIEEIDGLLKAAGMDAGRVIGRPTTRTFPSGKTYDCLPQTWFYLSAYDSRALLDKAGIREPADLPGLVTKLSQPARAAMLAAMMAADGTDSGDFGKKRKPGVMDSWQILAALEGHAIGKVRPTAVGDVPVQRLRKQTTMAGSNVALSEPAVEAVWCPTTAFGTWVMRQDGQVTITGNTKAKRRGTLALCGLGALVDEPEGRRVDVGTTTGEIVEPDPREQGHYQPPRAKSPRFHTMTTTAPEPTPEDADADAEPATADEGASEDSEALSATIHGMLSSIHTGFFSGEEPKWSHDKTKRAGHMTEANGQLRLHDYDESHMRALYAALHYAGTGETLALSEIEKGASVRCFTAVEALGTPQINELRVLADWWLENHS